MHFGRCCGFDGIKSKGCNDHLNFLTHVQKLQCKTKKSDG